MVKIACRYKEDLRLFRRGLECAIRDYSGVPWTAQRQRIKRDPVLAEVLTVVIVTITTEGATPTQDREMLCLPLEYLNGFLFGMNATRAKEDIRENLIRYQRECYQVLADAFMRPGDMTTTPQTAAIMEVREMMKHAPAEKHHMGVYETLRHQTGATGYKAIPPKGYEAAIALLDHRSFTSSRFRYGPARSGQ
jgi:hypothetical protein